MALTPPKAVLFDWDNTLIHSWPTIHQALSDTFTEWDMEPWTLMQVKERVGKSLRDAFPEIFGEAWERAGAFYIDRFRALHLEQMEVMPGALAVLEYMRAASPFVGVVSNKRGESLRKEAEHLGWQQYFDVMIGASDASHDKPHPAPALLALEGSGVTMGREVWFIGDTIVDLECAQAGGMTAILYGDAVPESAGIYRGYAFDHHAPTHDALLSLLREHC